MKYFMFLVTNIYDGRKYFSTFCAFIMHICGICKCVFACIIYMTALCCEIRRRNLLSYSIIYVPYSPKTNVIFGSAATLVSMNFQRSSYFHIPSNSKVIITVLVKHISFMWALSRWTLSLSLHRKLFPMVSLFPNW